MEIDFSTSLPIGCLVSGSAAAWPDVKALVGRTIRLECLDPNAHGDALWAAVGGIHNEALWQYLSEGPFSARGDFDETLHQAAAQRDPRFYAIVSLQTGCAVGWCAFLNVHPNHRSIEVGHLLFSPHLQQTAGATEALYLLARYAFDDLGYRRYEWKCNALNAKSRAAAERFGFMFEGVFRNHMIVKGRNRDSAWFSIITEEWTGVKGALEAWLSPGNFDDTGRQRRRLRDFRS